MRFDKLTLKAQEIIQSSQQTAERFGHQQIEPEHLMRVILDQKEGVIPPLLGKIGADRDQLIRSFESALEKLPRVSGEGYGQVYMSPRTKAILDKAFTEGSAGADSYFGLQDGISCTQGVFLRVHEYKQTFFLVVFKMGQHKR